MPRKGSRALKVDDVGYRYMVRESSSTMMITVEDTSWPGHVLLVHYASHVCREVGTVQMKAFVRTAKASGWAPSSMSNFTLTETQVIEALCA